MLTKRIHLWNTKFLPLKHPTNSVLSALLLILSSNKPMAEGVLFSVAEGIIGRLQSLALQEIGLLCGVKDDLKMLEKTVTKLKAVLLDAEEKQTNNKVIKAWLQSLEDGVYDVDDLLDEFYTEARRRQVVSGNKISKQVRLFFSHSNKLVFRLKIGHKIKEVRETLNAIAIDRKFQLDERLEETRIITEVRESHSFVPIEEIVGRDKDKKAIVQLLLNPMSQENVSVFSIVGIGGLGKTALAQLVFNDEMVQKHFELKIWVCVSNVFELNILVSKILESATRRKVEKLEINQLQNDLRNVIGGKRYLLVLDDVWNENREKWLSLKNLLMGGARGSRILITTRSEIVANITDTSKPYVLSGLDGKQSWFLFKQMAFKHGKEPENSRIKEIGEEIVERCKGVPLAIRTIGRMLYSKQQETEWLAFKNNDLSKISQEATDVLPTLKLSYNILPSHLKHCFAYCCLFPKDYEINIKTLVNLWMAQGFIKSLDQNECLEDVGYEYFMELLWRSFFQEEEYDEFGVISSCKMHDLMHDLAISVSGMDCTIVYPNQENFSEKTRHVSFDFDIRKSLWKIPTSLHKSTKVRTFLFLNQSFWGHDDNDEESNDVDEESKSFCRAIAFNFKSLRMLSLNKLGIRTLSNCLRQMRHLRYIDLSNNPIKRLPKWIVRLQNLQTLDLTNCRYLMELPRDIKKLFNLRHLMIEGCGRLTHMPYGLGELTLLHTLDTFVLSEDSRVSSCNAGLGELKRLNELRGALTIHYLRHGKDAVSEATEANMKEKRHLSSLALLWNTSDTRDVNVVQNAEMSLEALQPHPTLKCLWIRYYEGVRFSSWLSSLTNIVDLTLSDCNRCQYLPPLDHLPCLKALRLDGLIALEYISEWDSSNYYAISASSSASPIPFFHSLKELVIGNCPNLKGWWKRSATVGPPMTEYEQHLSFPCLSRLVILDCPNLTSMPLYPHLEEGLELRNTSLKPLEQTMKMTQKEDVVAATASASASTCCSLFFLLSPCFSRASDQRVSSPPLSKLLSLDIYGIEELTELPEGIGNLTSLRRLHIANCSNLASLPEGMRHLTSLESLRIWNCSNLALLPEGMRHLTSLKSLEISNCSNLALPTRRDAPPYLFREAANLELLNPNTKMQERNRRGLV